MHTSSCIFTHLKLRYVSFIVVLTLSEFVRGASVLYNVTPIPLYFGSGGGAINNNGQVVGYAANSIYIWSASAGVQTVPDPIPDGVSAYANSINDSGVVAGDIASPGITQAFIGTTGLGLGGMLQTWGNTLNNLGQLAGQGCSSSACQAFIATTAGYQFLSLPAIVTEFYGINSWGVATGYAGNNAAYGTTSGITTIPLPAGWSSMFGLTINDSGNICGNGSYYGSGGNFHAFYFNGFTVTTLAPDYYFFQVPLQCMNDRNQVIGEGSLTVTDVTQAFLWDPVNGLQPLNNLVPPGWNITAAYGINNRGSIVAYGSYQGGTPGSVLLTLVPAPVPASKVGIWRPSVYNMVAEDADGNLAWDAPPDQANFFGATGDVVIFGDWDGSGKTKMGIFRPSVGMFALDMNGNGTWDPGIDTFGFFGQNGDIPIVGDWTGDGKSKIGIFRPSTGLFALDINNNLTWDPGIDQSGRFGQAGDVPIIGKWTMDGKSKVGIFRNGLWELDTNGNLTFDSGIDATGTIGQTGDVPLLGDWNGDGRTKVGIYRPSSAIFGLDYNGNLVWDNGVDLGGLLGPPGATPVVGDWTGTGISRVGIFYGNGYWALDTNGNLTWDSGIKWGAFGAAGDTPVVGKWQ